LLDLRRALPPYVPPLAALDLDAKLAALAEGSVQHCAVQRG
jgi:hypothetical protein